MLLDQNRNLAVDDSLSLLAWAGWQLQVPGDWQPLKLNGTPEKGWMIVGDATCAMFSIHWEKARRKNVRSGHEWVDERFRRLGLRPDASPPAASRFTACGWSRAVQTEEGKKTTYWYGYAEPAELLLGVKVNGVLPEAQLEQIIRRVLPSLHATAVTADRAWAMHDVTFIVPPGYELAQRHLYMGDVALEFQKGRSETLLVRQVYPAELALRRRPFERWLSAYPFKEHRRLRKADMSTEAWRSSASTALAGLRRYGRKRLGFPLGILAPRWTHALAVHDETLDRLLIAEHMTTFESEPRVCESVIARMNEPLREGR